MRFIKLLATILFFVLLIGGAIYYFASDYIPSPNFLSFASSEPTKAELQEIVDTIETCTFEEDGHDCVCEYFSSDVCDLMREEGEGGMFVYTGELHNVDSDQMEHWLEHYQDFDPDAPTYTLHMRFTEQKLVEGYDRRGHCKIVQFEKGITGWYIGRTVFGCQS